MKKISLFSILLLISLTLCSCRVNLVSTTVDVPWYYVAIGVTLLFAILYVSIFSSTYICPNCKSEFKPKWYQLYVCIHMNGKRIAKCPKCGRKGYCERKR